MAPVSQSSIAQSVGGSIVSVFQFLGMVNNPQSRYASRQMIVPDRGPVGRGVLRLRS